MKIIWPFFEKVKPVYEPLSLELILPENLEMEKQPAAPEKEVENIIIIQM